MGTLTIGILSSLVGSMNTDFAIRLAEAAVAKGHKVNIWASGNGTTLANNGQKEFKDYSYLEKSLRSLMEKGVAFVVCEACARARGITEEKIVEGGKFASMEWYLARAAESDRVLHIGGE